MAAESCAMASATDRLIYTVKLHDALAHARLEVEHNWRQELLTASHLVTDARSRFGHTNGSSLMASERQTSLDILSVKQLPTWKQFADGLTKEMVDELFQQYRTSSSLNVAQTDDDKLEEDRRASLRRAQREHRKIRMAATKAKK